MDIVILAKLTGVVIAPAEYVVSFIDRWDIAAAHCDLLHRVAEFSLHNWPIFA